MAKKSKKVVLFFREPGLNTTVCWECYQETLAVHKDPDWFINTLKPGSTFQCNTCGAQIFDNEEDRKRFLKS